MIERILFTGFFFLLEFLGIDQEFFFLNLILDEKQVRMIN